jgi:hypothetical protein
MPNYETPEPMSVQQVRAGSSNGRLRVTGRPKVRRFGFSRMTRSVAPGSASSAQPVRPASDHALY